MDSCVQHKDGMKTTQSFIRSHSLLVLACFLEPVTGGATCVGLLPSNLVTSASSAYTCSKLCDLSKARITVACHGYTKYIAAILLVVVVPSSILERKQGSHNFAGVIHSGTVLQPRADLVIKAAVHT